MAVSAAKSGKFRIGADMEVVRLGFGSMRLTGRGIWGPPDDHAEAIRTLQRVPELGINFIDTADSYGPNVAEELIREALHPYQGVLVATKAGLARTGPDQWTPLGRAEYLIQQAYTSWSASICGSCTGSIRRCRGMSSSEPSSSCSTGA
jgi:pyridoxine 4-dehydrogenase